MLISLCITGLNLLNLSQFVESLVLWMEEYNNLNSLPRLLTRSQKISYFLRPNLLFLTSRQLVKNTLLELSSRLIFHLPLGMDHEKTTSIWSTNFSFQPNKWPRIIDSKPQISYPLVDRKFDSIRKLAL